MQIDHHALQSELQEIAGKIPVEVRLDKHIVIASSITETDKGFRIRLNPNRFHSPKKLEAHIQKCREVVSVYY